LKPFKTLKTRNSGSVKAGAIKLEARNPKIRNKSKGLNNFKTCSLFSFDLSFGFRAPDIEFFQDV